MLHTLYLLFIAPLEFLMRLVLEWGFSWTHSWGWSLVLLSLAVNTAILPIYNRAEAWQEGERALKRKMLRHEAMLRSTFKGQKRFFLLSALRRQFGYGYGFTLRASVGLLLQIPFFFAAYHLLSHFSPLNGQSFGFLSDLGAPDALLPLGGTTVNLLPLLMTAANLASSFVYTSGLTRRDKVQIYGMAVLFLVLLYSAPSALTLYWTLNNVYSLGKNIVEKRSKAWSTWQGQKELVKLIQVPANGNFGLFWAGWRSSFRACFGVGALCWVYIGTVTLTRHHDVLDIAFRSGMRHLAGQCILTAFLASLVLVTLIPPPFRRKSAWSSAFPALCAAVLFLLQFRFFRGGGSAGEQFSYFFELRDYGSLLLFGSWTLGIWLIGKFWDTLAGIAWKLGGFLLAWVVPPTNGKAEEEPIPSNRDTLVSACLMGLVCSLFLWYFMPFCTYFHNVNEFDFNGWELPLKVAPYCLLSFIASSMLLFAMTYFLPFVCVKVPWKHQGRSGGKVNITYIIVLEFLFFLWMEGIVLSYGLPQLDGRVDLYDPALRFGRNIIDITLLFNLLIVGIFYWRILAKYIYTVIFFLIIMCISSTLDFYINKTEKISFKNLETDNGLKFVSKYKFYYNLKFGRNHNIIILLIDNLDTLSFEKTLEIHPELKGVFDGFWLFRENLGPGGRTAYAVPQILSGKTYNMEGYKSFLEESLVGYNSMAANAIKYGYNVFVDAMDEYIVKDRNKSEYFLENHDRFDLNDVMPLLIFRFMPHHYKCRYVDSFYSSGEEANTLKFNKLISRAGNIDDDNVFMFIHFFGVHEPLDNNVIQATKKIIEEFSKFIGVLRDNKLYDKSTIVIMADHGSYIDRRNFFPERQGKYPTFLFPLMMLKVSDSNEKMEIRSELTSSIHMKGILDMCYHNGFTSKSVEAYLNNLSPVRTIFQPGSGVMNVTGSFSTLFMKKRDDIDD